jgi:hypothetical protein
MKKLLILITLLTFISCSTIKSIEYKNRPSLIDSIEMSFSIKDEINKSIIDGFYNNDTTGIGNSIYLLR